MAKITEDGARPRLPLSRERVLRAAVDLADREGIGALTMRRLGQELAVEAMSLYNHVANKDDLLNGAVDLVLAEMAPPADEGDWKRAIRASAISAHQALLRHSWACGLMLSPARLRPARLHWMEALLGCLRRAGFSAELTHHAYHALDSHVLGYTLWVATISADAEALAEAGAAVKALPVDQFPFLFEHIEQHLDESSHGEESSFAFGLDLILDGLERLNEGGGDR